MQKNVPIVTLFVLAFHNTTINIANNPINNANNRVFKRQSQKIFSSENKYN